MIRTGDEWEDEGEGWALHGWGGCCRGAARREGRPAAAAGRHPAGTRDMPAACPPPLAAQTVDPRQLQISLTGFLEKNTSLFCKVGAA